MTDETWVTVEDAAKIIGVHEQTIRRWLRTKRLPGTLLSRRAGYRIRRSEIDRILREGLPESAEGKLAA